MPPHWIHSQSLRHIPYWLTAAVEAVHCGFERVCGLFVRIARGLLHPHFSPRNTHDESAKVGVETLPLGDSTRTLAEDILVGMQAKANCDGVVPEINPTIRTKRGDLEFDVDGTQDIKIFRYRRETVSLFDMVERVAELETQGAALPEKLAASGAIAQAAVSAIETSSAKLEQDLAAQAKSLGDDISTANTAAANARTSLKSELAASIAAGVAQAKSDAATALATEALRSETKFAALDARVKALDTKSAATAASALKNKPFVVGWNQCDKQGGNGADSQRVVVMECSYVKKQDDTIMHLSINANQRQINGHSRWRIEVNTVNSGGFKPCTDIANHAKGGIYTRYHGSRSVDLHRPAYLGGACVKTSNNQLIKKGKMTMRYIQTDVSSDSYWNWESSARMIMEERQKMN
jgi:hypothetical protein